MTDIEYFKTLDWQPLLEGANDSCLFAAKDSDKTYLAGGGMRDGKLQVNIARVFEINKKHHPVMRGNKSRLMKGD